MAGLVLALMTGNRVQPLPGNVMCDAAPVRPVMELPPAAYFGAVNDYGTDIDIFICMVRVFGDAEVSIDIKRLGSAPRMSGQRVPDHNNLMSSEEEMVAVGATSIPKKRITGRVEAEIERLLTSAFHVAPVAINKLRQADLAFLF